MNLFTLDLMEAEVKVRKKREKKEVLTPVPTQKVRREKLKKEVRTHIAEKRGKKREVQSPAFYPGTCSIGDTVIFRFVGQLYRGVIVDRIEESDWAPPIFMVKSGDTTYPARKEFIVHKL